MRQERVMNRAATCNFYVAEGGLLHLMLYNSFIVGFECQSVYISVNYLYIIGFLLIIIFIWMHLWIIYQLYLIFACKASFCACIWRIYYTFYDLNYMFCLSTSISFFSACTNYKSVIWEERVAVVVTIGWGCRCISVLLTLF